MKSNKCNECIFASGYYCKVLKAKGRSDVCKFKKTEDEFIKGQEKAKELLRKKGLKSCQIYVERDGEQYLIQTTMRDDLNCQWKE